MGLLVEIAKTTQREMAGKTKVEDKAWSFREGIILFPETRCPFCKEVVKSKAIWQVDNKAKRLLGQGIPVKGQPFKLDNPKHPHVFTAYSGRGGGTCMGNAPDMITALFGAYNPSSLADTSQTISTWFKGKYWEHDCKNLGSCYKCHIETGKLAERQWGTRYYCPQCWIYEAEPAKKAKAAAQKKREDAIAAATVAEGKKNPQPGQEQQRISLAALLGQPEPPREVVPEILGFRFAGGGAGERIVVVPLDNVGGAAAEVYRCGTCRRTICICVECPECMHRVIPGRITDCTTEGHTGLCDDCHQIRIDNED